MRGEIIDSVDVGFFREVMAQVVELDELIADMEMEAEACSDNGEDGKAADIYDDLSGLYAERDRRRA